MEEKNIKAKKMKGISKGTLIATVDVGMKFNKGYCTDTEGNDC